MDKEDVHKLLQIGSFLTSRTRQDLGEAYFEVWRG